jgi:hypothetical protein
MHQDGATLSFSAARQQGTFEAAVVDSGEVSADALVGHTPFHSAVTSLQHFPRNAWWPLRLQLERLPGSGPLLVWLRTDPQVDVASDAGRVFLGLVPHSPSPP